MTKKTLFILGMIFLGFSFSSCNKECDFPEDTTTGDVIEGAVVLGGNSGGIATVHHSESGQYNFKVSFDEGYTYVPVDWTKYSIMNFPVLAGCNTHYQREVEIRPASQNVKYKMTIESCPDCEEEYRTDNWVLVKSFPSNYSVTYEKKVK